MEDFGEKSFDIEATYREYYNPDGDVFESDVPEIEEFEVPEFDDDEDDYELPEYEDDYFTDPDVHDWDNYQLTYDWDAAFGDSDLE